MKGALVIVSFGIFMAVMWYHVGKSEGSKDTTITPEKVSFAESSCKLGKWKTIDKNVIICNDGAIYKYNLEK